MEEDWACEARRYYFGIVGKYGVQVQNVLKKAAGLEIAIICPLHGPVLSDNLGYYLGLYNTWSSYTAETDGIVVCYTSVYGNTKQAALLLADKLKADFEALGLPVQSPYPPRALGEAMCKDKKAAGGRVKFILLKAPGEPVIQELTVNEAIDDLR